VNADNLDGVLLVDKPQWLTSHDVVARMRKHLGIARIGHAGTLDPMATGLLLILVGRATKISQYLVGLPKCYCGTMKLGVTTDSHDAEGEVMEVRGVENVTIDVLAALAKDFAGDQWQMPPMFSAKKINGKKLCDLARQGKTIERKPQFISVDAFDIVDLRGDEVDFFVRCSKGTYVRTLVNDFGDRLHCGAHLSMLCRTDVGDFSLDDALPVGEIEKMPIKAVRNRLIAAIEAIPSRILR
jgi:tRNA pseudouridine55 synthase